MEQQFVAAWMASREKAMKIGVRLRPLAEADGTGSDKELSR